MNWIIGLGLLVFVLGITCVVQWFLISLTWLPCDHSWLYRELARRSDRIHDAKNELFRANTDIGKLRNVIAQRKLEICNLQRKLRHFKQRNKRLEDSINYCSGPCSLRFNASSVGEG